MYQTPITDFTDLADALEASCTDLTGEDINQMDVTPNAGPTLAADITPADCAAVTQAIAATSCAPSRRSAASSRCSSGAPALTCGAGTTLKNVFTEDFEDGLGRLDGRKADDPSTPVVGRYPVGGRLEDPP